MTAGWRLQAIDNRREIYARPGLAFATLKAAQNCADRHNRRHSCRIEHQATGELWRRKGGSWFVERQANDPDWLARRQRDLPATEADGRPGPSS